MACCPGKKSTSSPVCGTNCFRTTTQVVSCSESTGPCGEGSGSKNLATLNIQLNGCTDSEGACDKTYQLVSYGAEFDTVALTEAGLLTWETSAAAIPNSLAVIRYRVFCGCNTLSATGKVYVCIKDLCANVLCGEDDACNKCNGLCEPIIPNAILT